MSVDHLSLCEILCIRLTQRFNSQNFYKLLPGGIGSGDLSAINRKANIGLQLWLIETGTHRPIVYSLKKNSYVLGFNYSYSKTSMWVPTTNFKKIENKYHQ